MIEQPQPRASCFAPALPSPFMHVKPGPPLRSAMPRCNRAEQQAANSSFLHSIKASQPAAAAHDSNRTLHVARTSAWLRTYRFRAAVASFERCSRRWICLPCSTWSRVATALASWANLANCYVAQKRYFDAVNCCEQALKRSPKSFKIWNNFIIFSIDTL